MSYNWQKADTPQGRERLKELRETEIVYRSSVHGISVVYIDPANLVLKDVEKGITNITEFLDPEPPKPQPDENGLLPCPFCQSKAELLTYQEGWFQGCEIRCPEQTCHAYKNTAPLNFWPIAQIERQKAKWNRRI